MEKKVKSIIHDGRIYQINPEKYGWNILYKDGTTENKILGVVDLMEHPNLWQKIPLDQRIDWMFRERKYRVLDNKNIKFEDGSTLRNPTYKETKTALYVVYNNSKYLLEYL